MKNSNIFYISKKYIYFYCTILLVLLSILFIFYDIKSNYYVFSPSNNLSGKTILIDPGHGGIDGGTSSSNILEKNINLEAALILKAKLSSMGANVIMTRDKDISLENLCKNNDYRHRRDLMARVNMINENKIDLYLSIHVNAVTNAPYVRGPMVFYSNINGKSKLLSDEIQKSLSKFSDTSRDAKLADYYLLVNSKKPGVLIELGFITNDKDFKLLQNKEYLSEISNSIIAGISSYFQKLSSN